MVKIILSTLTFVLLFAGCAPSTNTLEKKEKPLVLQDSFIYFFGQKLDIPHQLKATLTTNDYSIYNENEKVSGNDKGDIYQFNNRTKNMPYYVVSLNQMSYITGIKIKQNIDLMKIKPKNEVGKILLGIDPEKLVPLLFDLSNFRVRDIMIYGDATPNKRSNRKVKWDSFTLSDKNEKWIDIEYTSSSAVKDVHIAIPTLYKSSLIKLNKYSYYLSPNTISVEGVKADKIEEIFQWNLTKRKDTQLNEDLLLSIAKDNEHIFQNLKKHKKDYYIEKYSIVNLPNNANLKYAINNMGKIIKTGRYKRKDGKIDVAPFVASMKPTKEIIKDNTQTRVIQSIDTYNNKNGVKGTAKTNANVSYEDFSKGIF